MPRWPDKTVTPVENYSEEKEPLPEKKRVRVPGTIFEVDEDGVVHVPDQLLKALFDKKRYS